MSSLTRRQQAIYEFIVGQVQCEGIPPTLMEIARAFDLTSAAGISDHLKAIERKGYIRRRPGTSRGIELPRLPRARTRRRSVRTPILGNVPSQRGLTGEIGHVYVDGRALGEEAFAVRVEDDLGPRGVLRGDMLIVDPGITVGPGVLALGRQGGRTLLLEVSGDGRRVQAVLGQVDPRRRLEMMGPVVAVFRTMNGTIR